MKLSIELEDSRALIWTVGYINRSGGERISQLVIALTDSGVLDVALDLSESPIICAAGMEALLSTKERAAGLGSSLRFVGLTPTQKKVLHIMGIDCHRELLA